jgi:hypothetical protein
MRLWSLHPKYLDAKGLVALWREALLAKKVLEGKTKGYKNHPQLIRFKEQKFPLKSINAYLYHVYLESKVRGYLFDEKKILINSALKFRIKIPVSTGQKNYEFEHLKKKIKIRDHDKYLKINLIKRVGLHPVFKEVLGEVAPWEIVKF